MQFEQRGRLARWLMMVLALAAIAGAALPGLAQEGEWHFGDDDGRLNFDTHMGGINVYCVDSWKAGAFTYANGGGFQIVDPEHNEVMFVGEEAINAAIAALARTGQYQTLGISNRIWYNGQPIAMYLLANGEFQLNAADEHGKTVEFQWRTCREYTQTTGDGCAPAWDRDQYGTCVHENLY